MNNRNSQLTEQHTTDAAYYIKYQLQLSGKKRNVSIVMKQTKIIQVTNLCWKLYKILVPVAGRAKQKYPHGNLQIFGIKSCNLHFHVEHKPSLEKREISDVASFQNIEEAQTSVLSKW